MTEKQEKKQAKKKAKKAEKRQRATPGKGGIVLGIFTLLLALAGLGFAIVSTMDGRQQMAALARESDKVNQKVAALREAANAEKNRESVVIQMEPHNLAAFMSDSAYLYQTRFSSIRYEGGAQGSVKLRVPVTVTIFNTSDQTITVKNAALYPWETVFEETARQEALMAQQKAGFFGEIDEGQRDNFSIAPGQSYALEVDAKLRGVYGHPGLEFETHQFFKDYFEKQGQLPATQDDVAVPGKGAFNGQVNYLFCEALAYYCAQRNTRFTLSYVVETARGNTFSATCAVPF